MLVLIVHFSLSFGFINSNSFVIIKEKEIKITLTLQKNLVSFPPGFFALCGGVGVVFGDLS